MPESKKTNRKPGKQDRIGLQLKSLRQQVAGMQQNLERTHQLLGSISATYSKNDQTLHLHANDIEDKLVGMADALYAYSDILASALEEHLGLEQGFLPRLTEAVLVAAANKAQEKRIEAIKAQKEAEEAAKKAAEEAKDSDGSQEPPNLDEMSQEQIAEETDKTGEGGAEYPDGAQFFGE